MRSLRKEPEGHTSRRRKLFARAAACAFVCLAYMILAPSPSLAARAARNGDHMPVIHWDGSMIYPGQNNGDPWGPVGENAIVHGANFSPNTQLRLVVSPGDSNSNASACQQSAVTVVVATITTDNSGGFTQNFPWPATANKVNQGYSICSLLASNNSLISSQDDGPFTVLASSPPVINISATSVAAGGTVTVTGQNWVPPQTVAVVIAGCAACDPGNTYVTNANATSAGLNSGSFSVAIPIPSKTKPGNYVVDALTKTGLEAFYTTGVKHLTITAASVAPTPTPSPSSTVQPSPTPSPTTPATVAPSPTPAASATSAGASDTSGTVTTTNDSSGGSSATGSSGSSKSGIVFALIGMAVALFFIAGVILFALRRKRRRDIAVAQNRPPGPLYGQQFMQLGNPIMPYGNGYGVQGEFGQQRINPPQFAGSAISPMPQGNFTPSPVGDYQGINAATYVYPATLAPTGTGEQAQPAGVTPTYGNGQQANGSQPFYSQPTEAYNAFPQQAPQAFNQHSPILPTCPNCGRPLVPNLPACGVCGMPLEMMRR